MLNLQSYRKKLMSDPKAVFSAVASVAATAMLIRSIVNDFIPYDPKDLLYSGIHSIYRRFSSQLTVVIDEYQGFTLNQVFEAATAYLGSIAAPSVERIKVSKAEKDKNLSVTIDRDEDVVDFYEDVQFTWKLVCTQVELSGSRNPQDHNASIRSEEKYYELSFHKKHKELVLNSYLPFVIEKARAIKEETRAIQLHTVYNSNWDSDTLNLDHPMTFKTLAMDMEVKKFLLDDLDTFMERKEYYRKIGKAWKRGYLLFGPPGTGKTSLIAAMAQYLNYDIYDLDLTDIYCNADLRSLLLGMSNRSILVVEDIDCSIKMQNRESNNEPEDSSRNKVTLSGLLNFIDGLWSCCGEERIIVFTTNYKDRLDPALLRPGRMDVHIHLSYCTFSIFKQLALNYHGLTDHKFFEQIEILTEETQVSPAEVAGELMRSNNAETSLLSLIQFLQQKKFEQNKVESDENKGESGVNVEIENKGESGVNVEIENKEEMSKIIEE